MTPEEMRLRTCLSSSNVPDDHYSDHMKYIEDRLQDAISKGVEVGVIYYALRSMKKDSNLTLSQAFAAGCREMDI